MGSTMRRAGRVRTWVSMLALAMASFGLAAGEGSGPPALTGTTWQWTHLAEGTSSFDVPSPDYTIRFAGDGTLVGNADCNRFNGTFLAGRSTIAIVPGAMTLMACPKGSRGNEFVRVLEHVATFDVTAGGALQLEAPANGGTLTFVAQPQVTGTVTYRERIALPSDASVRVRLLDVSAADAPAVVIGEQVIPTHGKQVPFRFAVPYPQSAIRELGSYAVAAIILDDSGEGLFTTGMNVPVITGGNPVSDVNIVLVMAKP